MVAFHSILFDPSHPPQKPLMYYPSQYHWLYIGLRSNYYLQTQTLDIFNEVALKLKPLNSIKAIMKDLKCIPRNTLCIYCLHLKQTNQQKYLHALYNMNDILWFFCILPNLKNVALTHPAQSSFLTINHSQLTVCQLL